MRFSTKVQLMSSLDGLSKISAMISFVKQYPSEEGQRAVREFWRSTRIIVLLLFLSMAPLFLIGMPLVQTSARPGAPEHYAEQKSAHVSRYEEGTFWYTDSSQKYEFTFEEFDFDGSIFQPGEIFYAYLDDNNQIIAISPKETDETKAIYIIFVCLLVLPVAVMLSNVFIMRRTYAKMYTQYFHWFANEILPYIGREDFEQVLEMNPFLFRP